jgi:DNA polymerase-3 subunit beta
MTFSLVIERDRLLEPLIRVASVVEKKQTMPILGNILLELKPGSLSLIGSDSEVQLQSDIVFDHQSIPSSITVTGRKLVDICRILPANAMLSLTLAGNKLTIKSGKSQFSLATLPAHEFPFMEQMPSDINFKLPQLLLKHLLAKTHFSMALQDVRYYLNSTMIDINDQQLTCVATDGHRLACCKQIMPESAQNASQLLVPRKGVLELLRLLNDSDEPIFVAASTSTIKVTGKDFVFTSKLMEGKYPQYQSVIPKSNTILIHVNREQLQTALQRVAILSHEKLRGVRWQLENNELHITAHNPDQEWGEEILDILYSGEPLSIDFNVAYLLDALNAIDEPIVVLALSNDQSSVLLAGENQLDRSQYVLMPMQL